MAKHPKPNVTYGRPLPGDLGRGTTITHIEKAIASRANRKDPSLSMPSMPKEVIGTVLGFSIFRVSGEWIRNNLDVTFGTGGHGMVHTFIPMSEIWVDPIVEPAADIIFHELIERHFMMRHGKPYFTAHKIANTSAAGRTITMANIEPQVLDALFSDDIDRQPNESTQSHLTRLATRQTIGV